MKIEAPPNPVIRHMSYDNPVLKRKVNLIFISAEIS
jgi:hypothetical protein